MEPGKKTSRGRSRERLAEEMSWGEEPREEDKLGEMPKKTGCKDEPGENLGFHRDRAGAGVEEAPMSRGLVADGGGGGGSRRRWRWRRRAVAVKNLGSPSRSSVRRLKNLAVAGMRAAYRGDD